MNERKAITNLTNNDNIIIRSADKGGSIVIQNRDAYMQEANNILYDTKYYSILTTDPSKNNILEYNDLIKTAYTDNTITKKRIWVSLPK